MLITNLYLHSHIRRHGDQGAVLSYLVLNLWHRVLRRVEVSPLFKYIATP
jgi:hypothetical protein